MATAPKHPKKSAAQVKAGKAYAAAGRSAQARTRAAAIAKTGKPPPRSKKQKAATQKFAAAGRAAQAARRAGKTPVKPKAAAAPWPGTLDPSCPDSAEQWPETTGLPGGTPISLHQLPACGPVALAEHLALFTGILLPDTDVLALHNRAGVVSLADLLERVSVEGLAGPGTRLTHFERCDPDTEVPGLLYGVQLPYGYHAVLLRPDGMLSWGQVVPAAGIPVPEEAWWLEWEAE